MFGRQVILRLGLPGAMGREFRGLRIHFNVEMTKKSLSKAVIEMWNPAPDSIALAETPGIAVELLAGYDVPMRIFIGNPITDGVVHRLERPETILHIEAKDGQSIWSTRVNTSLATQTSMDQVFSIVAASMGVPVGTINLGTAASIRLTQGVVLVDKATDILDRICQSANLEWFIRDGALQVVPRNSTTGEVVPVFSALGGNLIGSPKKTKEGIEITGLLSPTLRPGKMFQVQSADINGMYICYALAFNGDSGFDNDFYVTARGKPV